MLKIRENSSVKVMDERIKENDQINLNIKVSKTNLKCQIKIHQSMKVVLIHVPK